MKKNMYARTLLFVSLTLLSLTGWGISLTSLELGTTSYSGINTGAATFTTIATGIASLPTLSLTASQQGQAGGSGYVSSNGWTSSSQNSTDYWQFTITASSGYIISSITSIAIRGKLSSSGISCALRSSADGYTTNIGGSPTLSTSYVTTTFSSLGLSNQSSITFRIYGWGGASGTTWRIGDGSSGSLDIDVQGTTAVTATPIIATPLPSAPTTFTSNFGIASTAQTFTVSGSGLTTNLIATAPSGFEVSSNGTTYGSTASYTQSSGSASGTLYIRIAATAPVGTYNSQNIVLSSTGATSVNITTLSSGNTVSAAVVRSNVTGVYVPQYICDGTNYRTPYIFRAAITGLTANTTYRYFSQMAKATDIGGTNPGVGNTMFVNTSTFSTSSSPSLTSAGAYGTFLTDGSGNYTGWFGILATSNAYFATGGQTLYPVIAIGSNSTGAAIGYFMADLNSSVTSQTYGTSTTTSSYNCSALRGSSSATAKNFILIYDTIACGAAQRPISGTVVEDDGLTGAGGSSYGGSSSWYTTTSGLDGTAGAWGCIIPNAMPRGIRRIEQRDASATITGCASSYTGVWATGSVNTVNPTNSSTSVLAISATDAPLTSCNTITTNSTALGPYCYNISNNITLGYSITGSFTGQYNIQYSDVNGTFPTIGTSQLCTFVSGTAGSSVTATLPSGLTVGTKYRFRVVNPTPSYFASCDNGNDISLTNPPSTPNCSTPSAICSGSTATITGAGSTGATSYTYWTASTGGSQITSGVSSGNLTTPALSTTTIYYVQGENTCSSSNRQSVTVTVNALPATPANPTAAANPSCGATSLNTMTPASGTTYYWQGTTATGTSTASPSSASYPVSSSGTYNVRARDNTTLCWSNGSGSLLVTINTPISISSQPASIGVTSPAGASFTVVATGTISSYQWQVNTGSGFVNVTNTGVYTGATSATLTISDATGLNGYIYQCIITAAAPCTNVTSSSATLTVTAGPCITEGFNGGTTPPTGWAISSSIGTYTSSGNYGAASPSLKFQNTGDQVTTSSLGTSIATSLSFWIKGQGTDAASSLLVEGYNGSSWTSIDNIAPLPTSGTTYTYNSSSTPALASGLTQFRFTYTKSAGNLSFDDVMVNCIASCTSPNAIAFVTAPSSIVQDGTMTAVTVRAYCTSTGATATSYTGNITLTASGNGCGYTSQTVAAVNGVATFSNIKFNRSTQTGITLTASGSSFSNIVSGAFNVTTPSGSATNTTIINENFDGSTPTWPYSSSLVSSNTSNGSPFVGLKDYTTNPYGNSTFKKSLIKSQTANNNSNEGESTNQILFSNISGLGSYNSVQVSFLIGSLPSLSAGASGNGVDANENMIVETSLDGGTTWNTTLTYYGSSNYLIPLSNTSPATLAYNANASYNADLSKSSQQSAFVINLPSGSNQFRMRITATDNREEENWAIDNIQIIGTTIPTGGPKPLPTATGNSYNSCASSSTPIGVALTNTQGTTTYIWSPTTNISSNTSSGPSVSPSVTTNYTVTVTDADGCTASATDAINIISPLGNVVLASATLTAVEPSCPDATGWTYYTDPSNASNWVFGIYKNGNTFTANVDITVKSTPDVVTNSSLKKATYTMGRYWNVTLATGSINGATKPVKVRFFYSPTDTAAMRTTATSQANSWGLTASNVNGVEWFKTNTGLTYIPSNNTYSDVPNKLTPGTFTTSTGTVNGVSYIEYGGLQGFSGGTAGMRLSPGGYALPVELLYVTATPINNDFIRLNWATASELDNDGFDIERSTDGISFVKIGFIIGHNTSSSENHYIYEDKNVLPNAIYYYRLKQIDNDGKSEHSTIISAMLLSQQGFVMDELKPNPASNKVVVNAVAADVQSATVSVTDMLGRTVLTQEWQLSAGLNGTQLDISTLATGTYSVTVKSENGNFTKRLAVSR